MAAEFVCLAEVESRLKGLCGEGATGEMKSRESWYGYEQEQTAALVCGRE